MKIVKLTCALLLSAWVSSANATLIFDFSFTNIANGGGFVIGEILGLDEGTGSASSVRIVSNTSGYGVGEYVSPTNYYNEFTIVAGALTEFDFISFGGINIVPAVIDSSFKISISQVGLRNKTHAVRSSHPVKTNFVITRRMVDVPEPGTVILLSLGLAGLSFARYRRQS
jgi:hypothetical protein